MIVSMQSSSDSLQQNRQYPKIFYIKEENRDWKAVTAVGFITSIVIFSYNYYYN